MRTLRQILHGCKKHHYVYLRDIQWFEGARYKTKLICKKCRHIENSKVEMMIVRSAIDEIDYERLKRLRKPKNMHGYGYQPSGDASVCVIRKPPVKP